MSGKDFCKNSSDIADGEGKFPASIMHQFYNSRTLNSKCYRPAAQRSLKVLLRNCLSGVVSTFVSYT